MSGAFIDHQVAHCALPLFVVPYQDYLWTHKGSSYRSGSRFSMKGFTIAITANLAAGVTQESLQYFDGRRFRTHFDWLAALVPKGWKPSSSTLTQEDVSDTDIRASFENASLKLDSESGAALLASCLRKDRHLAFLEVSRALLQNLAQHLLVLGQLPHIVRDHVEHLLVLGQLHAHVVAVADCQTPCAQPFTAPAAARARCSQPRAAPSCTGAAAAH